MRTKKSSKRYLALALAALISVPLSISGLWVESSQANDLGHNSEIDYSANLNGTSQYFYRDAPVLPTTGDFVVEAWIFDQDTNSGGTGRIISQGNTSQNLGGFDIMTVNSAVPNHRAINLFYKCPSSCGDTISTGVLIPNNSWQHIALVTSGSSFDLYLNGQLASSRTVASTGAMPTDARFVLGRPWLPGVGSSEFKGKIDEVNVWTKPGTITTTAGFETWIQGHMHNYVPADSSGLLARFDFNEGSGSTVFDRSAGNNDLSSFESPTFSDVKNESYAGGKKVLSFPRSYLTPGGGWAVPNDVSLADVLVVGGGGGGGAWVGGGGGGGGVTSQTSLRLASNSTVPVKVGQGGGGAFFGTDAASIVQGSNGQQSSFGTSTPVVALGGGRGASNTVPAGGGDTVANGGGGRTTTTFGEGASFDGGSAFSDLQPHPVGGGAGAGGNGFNGAEDASGNGGPGVASSISGNITFYGGGGGGSAHGTFSGFTFVSNAIEAGQGGSGGGGAGAKVSRFTSPVVGDSGAVNTGGGGGGSANIRDSGGTSNPISQGGQGGSGVVIVSYSFSDKAVSFKPSSDNPDDYIGKSNFAFPSSPFTVEAWIRPESFAAEGAIFAQGAPSTRVFVFINTAGNPRVAWGGTTDTNATISSVKIPLQAWTHIALSRDESNVPKLYVNSVLVWTGTANTGTYAGDFRIGEYVTGDFDFNGEIDQVKIWSTALDAENLAKSMHTYSSTGVAGTLFAHFDMNEPGTLLERDRSGNGRDLNRNLLSVGSLSSTSIVETADHSGNQTYFKFKRTYLSASDGWEVPAGAASFKALVVGGGGAGGGYYDGGGGGAGGLIDVGTFTPTTQIIRVVVGQGGQGGRNEASDLNHGTSGQDTYLENYRALGGGGGGGYGYSSDTFRATGFAGGSGGGHGEYGGPIPGALSIQTTDGVTYASAVEYGNSGGSTVTATQSGSGGGGAGTVGANAVSGAGGVGGSGFSSAITGEAKLYAAGGGGADRIGAGALGGSGIGGQGGGTNAPGFGESNTGSGGGGGNSQVGGSGGSGVVVMSYVSGPEILAATGLCNGTVTSNGLTVEAGHGEVFYIDTGQGQEIDAAYIAYKVSSASARSDLWVEVSGFTGGSVTLANNNDSALPLGAVAGNGSRTAFFMVKAKNATTTAQSHVVNVYDTKPTIGSPRPIYTCNYTFTAVEETIKAAANKVNSVTTSSVAQLGATMTITVDGDTGTIGQGNDIDGRMIWLTPAARSNWPTGALRLESTTLTLFSNSQRTNVLSTHSDTLRVNATTSPALSGTNRQYYRAVYTFRVIGPAATTAPIIPVAMISSGTQIKHTDVSGISGGTVDITKPVVNLKVTKNVSPTTIINADGTTTFNYTISLVNGGSQTLLIDEVIDSPDTSLKYKAGSAEFNGASIEDPGLIGTSQLGFSGPMTLPASSTRTITYQMVGVTCEVGESYEYSNTATARSGTVVIGSGSATQSVVDIRGNCGEAQAVVEVKDEPIPPTATTVAADAVTTTTATINGIVDPNGEAGRPIRFTYGTSSTLTGGTPLELANDSTASSTGYGVDANLTGLQPGETYFYRVEIQDKSGAWVLGEIMSFTTDPAPAPPSAETNQVTAITTSTATFNGSIDPNLVSGGAKASYEWGLANVDGTCTGAAPTGISLSGFLQSETVPANPEASPPTAAQTEDAILTGSAPTPMTFDVTGLTEGAKYCVRIVGHHGANFGTRVEGAWVPFTMTAKLPQVITFSSSIGALPAGGTTTVSAFTDSESGIEIRFESVDPSICTVDPITGAVEAVLTSGTCSITATQAGNDGYYPATPKTISFEISPPVITTPQSEIPGGTYGSALTNKQLEASGGSGTYSNWTVTSGSLPTGLTLNSSGLLSGTPSAAGIYTFTVTTQSNGITSAPVTYTITIAKVPVVITAANVSVVYGSAVPSVAPVSYSGFVGSDNASNVFTGPGPAPLNIAPTCSTDYQVGDNAGTTNRTTFCSGAWSTNYTFTYVDGTVTITKLALVVQALDAAKQNRVEGSDLVVTSDPSFAGKFTIIPALPSGQTIQNATGSNTANGGITLSRATSGNLSSSDPGVNGGWPDGEDPGTYAITPTGATSSTNYTITYLPGVFTIQTPKGVPLLSSESKTVDLGETDASNALDIDVVNPCSPDDTGTITYRYHDGTTWVNITSVASLNAGLYTIRARYIPNETSNCYGRDTEVLETTYQLTIQKAIATITATTSQKWVGDADPEFTWTITGLSGSVTEDDIGNVTLVRTSGELPGSYNVTPSGASHPNYTFNYIQGKLYIAKILINTNADGGVLADRNVSLTCAGLKPGAAITLKISTPEQVLATGTAANDGTCSVATTIPSNLLGNFRLDTVSQFPTSTSIANTRLVSLVTDPPVDIDPPTENPPTQNPPVQNPPGNSGGGGLPGPGSLNPAPRPTPSPTPTRGNIPSIPTPGGFVLPRPTTPTPTPSPSSTEQNVAKGPTQADPLATPPLATPPRLPGVPTVLPALPGTGGNAPSSQQRPATVDTGSGVRALEEVASDDSGLASSSRQSGVRTVDELANEKLGGFAPGAGVRIEILGAKTGARFVLADLQAIDAVALIRAMEASIGAQATDFSRITRVVRTERPLIQRAWEPEVRKGINEFFAAVGLDAPRALIDLDLSGVQNWVSVQAEVETYQPGSTVFLVATSSPIVLATAEVDQNGRAMLAGAIPVEALGSGEHRVRVVGIRSLEGVSVDEAGEIQLSEALLAEIQRFDLGTQSTIALSGLNPEGGYHSAIRVVPLVPVAPWWTLWFILAGFFLAIGARYRRLLDTPTRRVIAASGVVASALPAVIIGWVSTVTSVVWVGILLGLVGAVASWFAPEKKASSRSR